MRFFLSDLPTRTTEEDLRALFQDYGDVEHVELKTKEQLVDSGQSNNKVIAFVTVQTEDADYCVNELNWQRLHGTNLRVSIAKESFLDRLKREREEDRQKEQTQSNVGELNTSRSRLLAQNTQNKRRVFGENEEINDEDVAPELLITKKRAAHSMHNGKIVIQKEHDVKPLHIIEQHKKPSSKSLDAQASIADLKRKESLNKMQQQHQQKKSAIQQALAFMDAGQAKRIKFSDAEEEDEVEQTHKQKAKHVKKDLFEDNDDEEEEIVLPQHSGKKGERLVEMQSKQSLDPRFRITANFVGEEADAEADEYVDQDEQKQKQEQPQEDERNWQMGILEQVIGRKIDTVNAPGKKASNNKKMLRFDPAKEEHQKLVRVKSNKDQQRQQPKAPLANSEDAPTPAPVSQSAFYMVTDTLKQSLKTRGEGFSLLEMFSSSHEDAVVKRQDQLEKLSHEKILVNKSNKLGLGNVNPFSYDSSDTEDEESANTKENQLGANENTAPAKKQGKQKQKKPQIFIESFFIPKNDIRLKEGAKFFKSSKPELDNDNYDNVKKRLKFLITKKIAKTNKNNPRKVVKKNRINKKERLS
ncbi:probable RNA-binding protein CG14230 [Drosophila grimshawi]|uniref:GH12492 n=1 Tax=Drosophila grimshawi TaxID=7222 RepID=B4JJH8_DROGR|nr:probable RNA-binding protein CG14230 [Drosophila grimshawi]EDV99730.1 GH12492 [Drosophila grimshawi]